MAISETPPTSSRRSVLTAAVGGVAGAFLASLGRAVPARAQSEAIVVGGIYTDATSLTKIANTTTSVNVFEVDSSFGGTALSAVSNTGNGIYAASNSGIAIQGQSASAAIVANCVSPVGLAIQTTGGQLRFDDVSGVATIAAGTKTATVSLAVDIGVDAFALLTPMASLGGRSLWVTLDATANTLTVHISSSRSSATKVGWLLLHG